MSPRPDASMTLLDQVLRGAVDPGYQEAAARRGPGAPRRRGGWPAALACVVMGLIMVAGAQTLRSPERSVGGERVALAERVEQGRGVVEARSAAVVGLRADIDALRRAGLTGDAGRAAADELARGQARAAAVPVSGPGLVVSLDDAPSAATAAGAAPREAGESDDGRITARDLQYVTNELWAAGAEAIAVNGVRLTSASAIRHAGQAVLVAYRPLARPYTVTAIGGPEMVEAFDAGQGGAYLEELRSSFGVRASSRADAALSAPAGTVLTLRYATAVPGGPSPAAPAPSSKENAS